MRDQTAHLSAQIAVLTTAVTNCSSQRASPVPATLAPPVLGAYPQSTSARGVHSALLAYEMPYYQPHVRATRSNDWLTPAWPMMEDYTSTVYDGVAPSENQDPFRMVTLIDMDSDPTTSCTGQSEATNSVSREHSTVYCTLCANFSVRGHGELRFTPGSRDRSSHHMEVESLWEDVPAAQVRAQTTDEQSAVITAGPVPMTSGHNRQDGGRAAAMTYPTGPVNNGDDHLLNVTGEVFLAQMSDLVKENFLMFQTDWMQHMEVEHIHNDTRHEKLTALMMKHLQGILAHKLPGWSLRPMRRMLMEMLTEITGWPLTKLTMTFRQGKVSDVPDSITYA
ncbi:hypothetical protein H4R24_000006 [Coemansia sp. RSA 988]|nr:hypothetical protein H4R24_003351 [Coemansia sp. RSA 988]KAJ2084474.1 hypothetical protein H4R24_000006 [Coemansia sp. RSA 988]